MIFLFFCLKFLKVIFQREDIKLGCIDIHLLNFSNFDPNIYLNCLSDIEKERFSAFTNLHRKQEFVSTRKLRTELFGLKHIQYDEVGAPYIKDEKFFSISHSKNSVGIAVCKDFKIGLDIEKVGSKIQKIKHKFLSIDEIDSLDINSDIELTKIWTAKEVLYKISGRNGINFRTELSLQKENNEKWAGIILNEDHVLTTKLNIFEHEDSIISVNISASEKVKYNIR